MDPSLQVTAAVLRYKLLRKCIFSIHHTPEEIRLYFNDLIANFKEASRRRENDSITAGLSVLDSPSARSKPE